jgi:hypothetical protein
MTDTTKTKYTKKPKNNILSNTVINLSNKNLPTSTISTLTKGLNYIPSPKPTPYEQVYTSFLTYRKNMYNKYYFRHSEKTTKHPFQLPTIFTSTPTPDNSNLQEYISNVYHDIKTSHNIQHKSQPPNLSKQELDSMYKLRKDNDLVVKPADK